MDGNRTQPDAPGVIAIPPLLYGGALALGLFAHFLWPVRPLPPLPARVAGAVLVLAAGLWMSWGERALRRAGTNVRPDRPTLAIVTGGPFRYSRNPLYLGLTVLYVGVTLLVDALWPLVLLVPLLGVVQAGVVRREERYLEAKFGAPYLAYRARVRRWL